MSKLNKTLKESQFYQLHSNSKRANEVFTAGTPAIEGRTIEVLQVLYIDNEKFNLIIEFIYKDKD